jgi:hypothetical protein
VLVEVGLGQALDTDGLLNRGGVRHLLALVVVVQHLAPALAEGEEVVGRVGRHLLALEVHGVHAADQHVVRQRHR